ncbi:MAG TPA: CPBP family intramembrane glutamic endopeptidase [Terriglobales bacterium]|nr:CPBP family intramembrane glutamic endopeptidase [Terriglobales bacterium]
MTHDDQRLEHPRAGNSKVVAIAEMALVELIFLADWYRWHHLIRINKTPYLLVLAWISLRLRGLRWKSVGWGIYRTWAQTFVLGIVLGLGMELLELFVTQPVLVRLLHKWPDLTAFRPLIGNVKLFIVSMLFTWVFAALGEELVYRGYLMNRIADLFGGTRASWRVSLVVTSIVFGVAHFGQGWTGEIENAVAGLLLGGAYLLCGRKLAVPILAHGIQDTIDFLLIFLGKYPAM